MKKPLLLVAGFLGTGKTSLIRGLLNDFSEYGMKADVILNDIANAELDAASINTNHASSIVPLSASCACCESLEELM
ncbi:MAG: GTP-binding protein, partial [Verrucomicrobiales bacterium]